MHEEYRILPRLKQQIRITVSLKQQKTQLTGSGQMQTRT